METRRHDQKSEEAGCDDYAVKPVEFLRLLAKSQSQLNRVGAS